MSNKEEILSKYRKNVREKFDMPSLDDKKGITYPSPLAQFISMTETVGGKVVELGQGQDINELIKELYPDYEIQIAPDIDVAD